LFEKGQKHQYGQAVDIPVANGGVSFCVKKDRENRREVKKEKKRRRELLKRLSYGYWLCLLANGRRKTTAHTSAKASVYSLCMPLSTSIKINLTYLPDRDESRKGYIDVYRGHHVEKIGMTACSL
jgi:hypothetical protein